MSLTFKVIIGMILGISIGIAINLLGLNQEGSFVSTYFIDEGIFHIVGTWFVNALKMLVVPLVLLSLVSGVCGIGSLKLLGRVGVKSFVLYLLTTAIAIASAISVSAMLGIGQGLSLTSDTDFTGKAAPSFAEVLINIIPKNPIQAMASGEMLQVIFFSILVGISLLMIGKRAKPLLDNIELGNELMMKMVGIVMEFAPYAVFCLLAKAFANFGPELLGQLSQYVFVLIGVLFFHLLVVLPITLKVFSGLNPVILLRKIRSMWAFAFSTASSNATIPVTLQTVTKRLGVDNAVASFTVPFGATINMDGTAIMQGVATVFIANIYGVDLGLIGYITVIAMAVLASVGTAGVPGVGLIMLSMVFAQVGVPIEGIGLILGVDRLLDMIRTMVNVSGDAVVTSIVAKSEGKIDLTVYQDSLAGEVLDGEIIDKTTSDFIEAKV